MTYLECAKTIERITFLAQRKMTGTPKELAEKLDVSESTVKRIVGRMKEQNIEICYCKYENSYIIQ
jgi:Mn-dependent DtxR family transcriptional regulator